MRVTALVALLLASVAIAAPAADTITDPDSGDVAPIDDSSDSTDPSIDTTTDDDDTPLSAARTANAVDTDSATAGRGIQPTTTITSNRTVAVNKTFDYIIAGAGLTGLTVANKLAGKGYTVLVIEPGTDQQTNPAVYDAKRRGELNGACNWQYTASDETGAPLSWKIDSGKCLGGSSSINGLVWYRPVQAEIDAIGNLGNTGWNWNSLLGYIKGVERFIPPTSVQSGDGASYQADKHGFDGPVNTSFVNPMRIPYGQQLYKSTMSTVFGMAVSNDMANRSGPVIASAIWSLWYDVKTSINRRSSAQFAFLTPVNQQRKSQTVLYNHKVAKVTFSGTTATGVQFGVADGSSTTLYTASARREVLLAAGALASAPILERSGVGAKALNIKVVVDLPQVGTNLVDQPGTSVTALAKGEVMGNPDLFDDSAPFAPVIGLASISQLYNASTAASIKSRLVSTIPARAQALVNAGASVSVNAAKAVLTAATNLIVNNNMPVIESIGETYPAVLVNIFWPLVPQSRGYIHITSSDWTKDPLIVPRLLTDEFDVQFGVTAARKGRQLFTTSPLKDVIQDPYTAPADVGANATDAQYADYLRSSSFGASHWLGSTALLPRDKGGVVNPNLNVYGTSRLRVIDAGILPIQLSAHTSPTAYAIALKAADLISSCTSFTQA